MGCSDGVAKSITRLSMYVYTECNHSLPDDGLSICLSPHLDSAFLEGRDAVFFFFSFRSMFIVFEMIHQVLSELQRVKGNPLLTN